MAFLVTPPPLLNIQYNMFAAVSYGSSQQKMKIEMKMKNETTESFIKLRKGHSCAKRVTKSALLEWDVEVIKVILRP